MKRWTYGQCNKKKKAWINKIRDKKGEITTDTEEIQGIIKIYFKSLCSTKMEILKEMNELLNTY